MISQTDVRKRKHKWNDVLTSPIKSGFTARGRGSEETGNYMKNVEIGRTVWLITALQHATLTMPGVTSGTLLTHISLQFLHDDSLRAAVSGPAVPGCCQSGSHGTSSN